MSSDDGRRTTQFSHRSVPSGDNLVSSARKRLRSHSTDGGGSFSCA
jgi:hypothetical protein